MNLRILIVTASAAALLQGAAAAPVSISVVPASRTLRGSDAAQQFVVTATLADGTTRDVTSTAEWTLSARDAGQIDANGRFTPKRNGSVVLTARVEGRSADAQVSIEGFEQERTFSFAREIGGVLTRNGCNGASCHGGVKGRGGFKLSASALQPSEDYEWIVKGGTYQVLTAESKGERKSRIDPAKPENSLILLKATNSIPHGGGRRFRPDSPDYAKVLKWIRSGAPYGLRDTRENGVERLEVYPQTVSLEKTGRQQILVTAVFSDGRVEDLTSQAAYSSSDRSVATVDAAGIVQAAALGETSILVRAVGQVASATVGVIGPPVSNYKPVPANNYIDEFVLDKLRRFRVVPSDLTTDAEFIRRVCLDLTGTLPPVHRVREFLASKDARKRDRLIDILIASPEFIDYWTFRFDDLFRVAVFSNGIQPKWSAMYGEWVRSSIASNKPYDQMAYERLAAQGYDGPTRHFLPYDVIGPPAETMAEEVRVFFGRRLDCAQCHNHPYESWSQDQFWGLAAFFGRMFKMGDQGNEYVIFDHPLDQPMGNADVNGDIRMYHPRTKAELEPTLLDGTVVPPNSRENPRKALATWMIRHPWFAEAAVNRIWSYFFGRGIVDPVDDFRSTNPPSHPELLSKLADDFRSHGHDLRYLVRTITNSRTYQLSGRTNATNAPDRTNYSHALPRALDAEVLLDAISDVTGVPETFSTGLTMSAKGAGRAPSGTRAITLREPDLFYSRFLEIYGRPNRLTVPERDRKPNLSRALNMLAGPVYNTRLDAPEGRLRKLLRDGASDEEVIREFYLAAFSRFPERHELAELRALIAKQSDREQGLKDFVWAVLSSREFVENH
jgi:hypothetical protein